MAPNWVVDCLSYLRENEFTRIEADARVSETWTQHPADIAAGTMLPLADSRYMAANALGKPRQLLNYAGLQMYLAFRRMSAESGYSGFKLQ